jgi:tetratricopeptide (TPR) repeat protein
MNEVQELVELAKFYFLNKNFEESVEKYEEALKLEPKDARIYYNLGIVYETMNVIDKAKQNFRLALELDETLAAAKEHLDKLVGE